MGAEKSGLRQPERDVAWIANAMLPAAARCGAHRIDTRHCRRLALSLSIDSRNGQARARELDIRSAHHQHRSWRSGTVPVGYAGNGSRRPRRPITIPTSPVDPVVDGLTRSAILTYCVEERDKRWR